MSKVKTSKAKAKKTETAVSAAPKKKKVTLSFEAEPGLKVFVAGSFNQWSVDQKTAKQLKEDKQKQGFYSIAMFLPPGEHEYKFFSEGSWYSDPKAEVRKLNSFGTFNSVLSVA